jgi:hypothetical protein
MNKSFYYNEQVRHVLAVLNYEFGTCAFESTDRNDECPSVIVTLEKTENVSVFNTQISVTGYVHYKVYLPSDHSGDYAEFVIVQLSSPTQDPAEGDFIDGFKCLADVVAFFNNII